MLERGAGLDDMHCSRNHARSSTCRDVCTGIRTCLKYMFMYMKLGLQRRISACRTAAPRTLARCRCMRKPLHCDCTAVRLPWVFTLLKIQASIHVHVHELYSAEYRCMVKVCTPCVGRRRIYIYITKMTRTWANFTSLVCTASLLSVVCYPQERQKAFHSGSPQNVLHCLVVETSPQNKIPV